tara:strand:- start:3948 stop:4085 length:138 start_codon:yes stop_codon:yes gene_type:complete
MITCRFANVEMILFCALFIFRDERINDLSVKSSIISDSFFNFSGS